MKHGINIYVMIYSLTSLLLVLSFDVDKKIRSNQLPISFQRCESVQDL